MSIVNADTNSRVVLAAYASGVPGPEHLHVVQEPIPVPGPDQALCRSLYVSLDPWQRVRMLPPESDVPMGSAPLPLGSVIPGRLIGEVVESHIEGLPVGALVRADTGWETYSLVERDGYDLVDGSLPLSASLGVLGMPGLTGWSGLKLVGRPNPGETVVVSAASGAVGSLVVQLARRWGCRAVGIAGSDEKCRWVVEELGADACVSHRSPTLAADLAAVCPEGADVYFDNVGGDVLMAVLTLVNPGARIAVCGRISLLNSPPGGTDRLPTVLGSVLTRRLTIQGFEVSQFEHHRVEFEQAVGPLVAAGEIRYREDVIDGLEQIPTEFGRLFDGTNFGKLVARI
jgi:NADPH-dependent curcumin reductase CurA